MSGPDGSHVIDEYVRLAIYRGFARDGRCPTRADLERTLDLDPDEVAASMLRLADQRHVALADDGTVLMAHPFSTIPLGFSVMGHDTLWWGGCAWDSFAVPSLVTTDDDVLVATRCPGCGRPLAWVVGNDGPPSGDEVAHFLVPMVDVWDDVVHACGNQRLFCSEGCVDAWLERTGNTKGYVTDLATLWRLSSRWYAGRLDYGYTRRDPETAADYFRSVGLHGPFWGLDD